MASSTLSFFIDDSLATKLDELVSASNRERQYHLQRALEQYLATAFEELQAIDEGIADAEAGRLTDLEIVKAEWLARANNSAD
ncbi:transcriptional regulator [Pseudomonas phytophila]|uniref:Transcriptional regulator n=1 Tax=Pseudomonas phytophila TaxID=2867264 RepID=A0ABY6FDR4_9PSED|nr:MULTISPECIES: transcriptional regulator [Pseudomonas]MCD5987604.1 transcriptional regulator [Pseudomonas quasicaspiana]UXZ96049.1 transcriptional regulator [Pseudomonas phytophila]